MSNQIFNSVVSFQTNTFSPITKELSIGHTLNLIKGDYLKDKITILREHYLQDKDSYNAEKLQLPAVTFCGNFNFERKKDKLINYNNLIVIDIDKLSKEQIGDYEKKLFLDPYVISYWRSPSNFGIKGIVNLNYNFQVNDVDHAHKSAFNKLYNYFEEKHNIELDRSGSDTTRLCFLSHDPDLLIKSTYEPFNIDENDLKENKIITNKINTKSKIFDKSKKNALFNPSNRNRGIDKREMKDIINFLEKRKIVISGEYESRYKIAYSIANTFTFDIGKLFFSSICQIEKDKYNEFRELKLLEYCYENNSGFIKFEFLKNLVKEKYSYKQKTIENAFSNGTKK